MGLSNIKYRIEIWGIKFKKWARISLYVFSLGLFSAGLYIFMTGKPKFDYVDRIFIGGLYISEAGLMALLGLFLLLSSVLLIVKLTD